MLDPWIIEEILKKEEELRREQERSHVELPIERAPYGPRERPTVTPAPEPESERGVMIIDI
jgi:hypothetical protein